MSQQVFKLFHWMPPQAKLLDGWEDAVWDLCLRTAHERNLMPVGPIMIRDATREEIEATLEKMHPFQRNPVQTSGLILIVAEVMIGASL